MEKMRDKTFLVCSFRGIVVKMVLIACAWWQERVVYRYVIEQGAHIIRTPKQTVLMRKTVCFPLQNSLFCGVVGMS